MKYLSILAVLLLIIGCDKKEDTPDTLPVTPEVINAAQRAQLGKLDPYSIQQGQRVHSIESQEIMTAQGPLKNLTREWVTSVTELTSTDGWREIVTLQEVNESQEDDNFVYEVKNVFYLPEIASAASQQHPFLVQSANSLPLKLLNLQAKNQGEALEVTGVAYRNLQTRPVPMSPPALVKKDPNCKGIPDCRIEAELLTYEIIFQISDGSTQNFTVEWFTSTEVPYFAGVLKQCATSLVSIEQTRVLLKQCEEVVDFDFESTP